MSDLIERSGAIDALKDMYQAAEKWGQEANTDVIKARAESCMASLVEMKLRIEKMPSAQQELKLPVYYKNRGKIENGECPTCGYIYDRSDSIWGEPFCPHCGQALDWGSEGRK